MGQVTVGLLRLGTVPSVLKHQHPGGLESAVLAQGILAGLEPQAKTRLLADQSALTDITTFRALQEASRDAMAAALAEVKDARTALLAAAGDRIEPARADIVAQTDALAQSAGTLSALSTVLAGLVPQETPDVVGRLEHGALAQPVVGRLIAGFGAADDAGVARSGLLMQAATGALVIAPDAATVAYAGPFLDGAQVVVLRIGPNALMAINGLGATLVSVGMPVQKGDPLGFVGGADTGDEEFLISQSTSVSAFREEPLYIELRIDGIATDPAPFFENVAGQER